MRRLFSFPRLLFSLSIWIVVEKNGRDTENHSDIVAVEDPERVGDKVADVDEVLNTVKEIGLRSNGSDGAHS